MVNNPELLKLSLELAKLAVSIENTRRSLITKTADLNSYETALFKLCLTEFYDEVDFLVDKKSLISKITDDAYCDEVYSVVSRGIITFYDGDNTPILKLLLNSKYAEV